MVQCAGGGKRGGPRRTSAVSGKGNPGKSQTVATRDDPKKRLVSRRQKADRRFMSTVMEIEKAIEELPSRDMQKLFSWVEEK